MAAGQFNSEAFLRGTTIPIILGNLAGAVFCTLYFTYLGPQNLTLRMDPALLTAVVLTAVLIGLGSVVGVRWSKDFEQAGRALGRGDSLPADRLAQAQRKALNGPIFYALLSLFNWVVASVFMGGYHLVTGLGRVPTPALLAGALQTGLGTAISGVVTCSVVFFYLDLVYRKIRPLFFPAGGLLNTPGAFRMTVRTKLLFTYMLISVVPILAMGLMTYHQLEDLLGAAGGGRLLTVFWVVIALTAVLITVNVILSRLVAANIADPIYDLEQAMSRVRSGDFGVRVEVAANDELGLLADSFNQMIVGLAERERMRRSLALADEVQRNLLPTGAPQVRGLDLAGRGVYCDQTGGDYFDFLAAPQKDENRVRIVVGDVSDHGVQSALLMATARAFIRRQAADSESVAEIATEVNRHLNRDVEESGQFMTACLCDLDTRTMTVHWVTAGHDPALLYLPEEKRFEELGGRGLALGVIEDLDYQSQSRGVEAGQVLVMATDGIWEAAGEDGQRFGKQRVRSIIADHAHRDAQTILHALFEQLRLFIHPRPLADDVTVVVAKFLIS
jgi:sigma-B regulation protein RsbU (phosphoserine phosphatase)